MFQPKICICSSIFLCNCVLYLLTAEFFLLDPCMSISHGMSVILVIFPDQYLGFFSFPNSNVLNIGKIQGGGLGGGSLLKQTLVLGVGYLSLPVL